MKSHVRVSDTVKPVFLCSLSLLAVLLLWGFYCWFATPLSATEIFKLINCSVNHETGWQTLAGGAQCQSVLTQFDGVEFLYTLLPRSCLAVMIGAALGLSGSLLQQLTLNPLVSPLTLGASSGAWLALVILTLLWPSASFLDVGHWVSLAGALGATILVFLLAGFKVMSGTSVILAGMAIHMLLSALAMGLITLNDQSVRSLFLWGAGDLTQTDWLWVEWLLPKVLPAVLISFLILKPLMLIKLGSNAASARGLNVPMTMGVVGIVALWLASISVTAVGLIAFIALMAPNIARALGARQPNVEVFSSLLLGSVLLLIADGIALWLSDISINLVPTGSAAAAIGAPYLILLIMKRRHGETTISGQSSMLGGHRLPSVYIGLFACFMLCIGAIAFFYEPFSAYSSILEQVSERWPKLLGAFSAGAGMAVAGFILQSLIRNPLASPDILGLSSGATLALIIAAAVTGVQVMDVHPAVAFLGTLLVMSLLLLLGRSHAYSPSFMVLIGVAITAFLDALLSVMMATGGPEVFDLLRWLSGSTYLMTANDASLLTLAVMGLTVVACLLSKPLLLLAIDDAFSNSRGLNVAKSRVGLLILSALLCAFVTSYLGPIAFVGLIAPHAARLMGARKVHSVILMSALLGGCFLLIAHTLGQFLLYPVQMPAGSLAAIIGGSFFVALIARYGKQHHYAGQ